VFRIIRQFFRRNDGQDLAEYCLLMAFVGLIALGIILKTSGGIQGIWGSANTTLASTPGAAASGSTGTSADSGTAGGQGH
jgi:Flp pilus assembly pilin Flp